MIPKILNIGPFSFHFYGFIIAVAILAGWYVAQKRANRFKIPQHIFEDYVLLIPLVLSIIGARIYHVLDYWQVYQQDPISMLYIQNGGLGIWGAIFGSVLGLLIVCKIRDINFLNVLDLTAPSFALGQAIGRIGNYINQEGFGPPTNLPWKVYIDISNRPLSYISYNYFHPTFFYESILDIFIFALLIYFSKKQRKSGQVFALYLILYSIARIFIEFFRIDTWVVGSIKMAQVISILGIIVGAYLFARKNKAKLSRQPS